MEFPTYIVLKDLKTLRDKTSDIKAINILLLGLPVDICTLINHYQTAKEIWDRVKELMEGTKKTKQEHESMLYDEFDKFTSKTGESIHSYYLRFAKLFNDMNMILMSMTPILVYHSKFPLTNNQLRTSSNPRTQATIQNGQVTVQNIQGHMAKHCTTKKMVKDSEWFKVKMLLAQAQEAGVVLNDEQQDFLADSLEETDDYEDLQLQATSNIKADHVDAYDSDSDAEATSNAIFMANLSPVGSLNDDTFAPRYDFDTFSEVHHYDTYPDSDMLNSNIQKLGYIENIVSNNESYDELKGNNNVISYID
ncbi:hypothetical protein Tco_1132057 [Tanacetum coccineum]|uniref:Integrase, catalytic region, zinc finger, CCHC-type, peptidase aspartic, catalytic n=1 Tax=Tanacetum coccineum TaxID=301880 RepID=A0ABQ5JBG7_9ASTR